MTALLARNAPGAVAYSMALPAGIAPARPPTRGPRAPRLSVRRLAAPMNDQDFFGRLAPYLERDCLRSLTPCRSSEPRTMW